MPVWVHRRPHVRRRRPFIPAAPGGGGQPGWLAAHVRRLAGRPRAWPEWRRQPRPPVVLGATAVTEASPTWLFAHLRRLRLLRSLESRSVFPGFGLRGPGAPTLQTAETVSAGGMSWLHARTVQRAAYQRRLLSRSTWPGLEPGTEQGAGGWLQPLPPTTIVPTAAASIPAGQRGHVTGNAIVAGVVVAVTVQRGHITSTGIEAGRVGP